MLIPGSPVEVVMIKRVLVGVDFSEASRLALARAAAWASRSEVPLVVMHVLQPPAPMLPEAQIALPDPAWLKAMEDHAREHLQGLVSEIPGASVLVKWGSPAEELVGEAGPDCLLVVARWDIRAWSGFCSVPPPPGS